MLLEQHKKKKISNLTREYLVKVKCILRYLKVIVNSGNNYLKGENKTLERQSDAVYGSNMTRGRSITASDIQYANEQKNQKQSSVEISTAEARIV